MDTENQATMQTSLFKKIILDDAISNEEISKILSKPAFAFQVLWTLSYQDVDEVIDSQTPKCACAMDHEYFAYIDKAGIINNNMFMTICTSIENGHCYHVTPRVENQVVCKTEVSAHHVAIAAGNMSVYDLLMRAHSASEPQAYHYTQCFRVTELHLALLKHKYSFFHDYRALPIERYANFTLITKRKSCNGRIELFLEHFVTAGQICILVDDIRLIQCLVHLYPHSIGICDVIFSIFAENLDALHVCLDSIWTKRPDIIMGRTNSFQLHAVVANNMNLLNVLEKYCKLSREKYHGELNLSDIANLFQCNECIQYLERYIPATGNFRQHNPFFVAAALFGDYPHVCVRIWRRMLSVGLDINARCSSDVVSSLCECGALDSVYCSCGVSLLQLLVILSENVFEMYFLPGMCKAAIDLGYNVSYKDLAVLLNSSYLFWYDESLTVFKMVLFCNPPKSDCSLMQQCIKLAIQREQALVARRRTVESNRMPLTRLLWIEGLPLSRSSLDFVEDTRGSPMCNDVETFLAWATSKPRSLKMLCRDVIRCAYPGAMLVRFLEVTSLPLTVQQFIRIDELKPTSSLSRYEGFLGAGDEMYNRVVVIQ